MRSSPTLTAILVLLAATPPRAAAQHTSAQIALGGGTATDVRGLSSSAVTVAPSLTLAGRRSAFRLGLGGTGFGGGGWAASGNAALDLRLPASRALALTLGAAAGGTRTSYQTSFVTLSGTPALELRLAPIVLFGGVRTATARTTVGAVVPTAGPFAAPRAPATTRSTSGPLFGGALALASRPRGAAVLGYREERSRVEGVPATDRTGTLSIVNGSVSLLGTLGVRSEQGATATFGGVRAALALSRVLTLQLGAERYPADRLTGTLGGRSVTAGLVLHTASGPRPLPRPDGIGTVAEGLTRLSIRAPDATAVEVAGDWNGWRPVAAHRSANGVWYADLAIPRGTWRYAFRIDRHEWRVPAGTTASPDGFGGASAWLTVADDPQQ
jgi:hypothetical protein